MAQIELQEDRVAVEIKLLRSGQYTWTISGVKHVDKKVQLIDDLVAIDEILKQRFPDFTRKGSGRVAQIDDED